MSHGTGKVSWAHTSYDRARRDAKPFALAGAVCNEAVDRKLKRDDFVRQAQRYCECAGELLFASDASYAPTTRCPLKNDSKSALI